MLSTLLCLAALTPEAPIDTMRAPINLDEATIVETKQNKRNLAPSSVSVVGKETLQAQEIRNIKELTSVLPNFYMPDYGAKQNSPIYIRGIGTKAKSTTVGFYVDGVPHYENSAFDVDLSDIERIEVLRGPQGTLFGRNAIGGTIALHSRSPLHYQGQRVQVGLGNYADRRLQYALSTRISEGLGLSASVGYHHNGGYFDNLYTGRKANVMDEAFGRVQLVGKAGEHWTLRLNSFLDYSDQGGYPYGAFDTTTGKVVDVNYDRKSDYRRLISTTGFNAHYNNDCFTFNSQTAFQYIDDKQRIDQDFLPQNLYYVVNSLQQKMLSQEFTLKSNHNGRYQWIVGAIALHQRVDNTVDTQYTKPNIGTPAHYDIPTTALALYHQSSLNLWRGLSATVGLRFDYEHAENKYRQHQYNLQTGDFQKLLNETDTQLDFHQFTPRFALQYLTTDHQLFYASLTRGYRAGGFNATFRNDAERTYNPEYNWNYEVGAKLHTDNQRLMAEIALFYIDWRQQQVAYTVPGKGNVLLNAGHSDSKGVELTLTARPWNGLTLQANYGYTYARFLDYQKSEKINYQGKMLPMVPRHTLAIAADYSHVLHRSFIDRLSYHVGLQGLGKIYWTEDNTLFQPFYTLLNAKVTADMGRLAVSLWAKNLLNTDYNAYTFKAPLVFAQKGRPTTLGVTATVNF